MRTSLLILCVIASGWMGGVPLCAQTPEDVAQLLTATALQDLIGYKTTWQVRMTSYPPPKVVNMLAQDVEKRLAEAKQRNDAGQVEVLSRQLAALQKQAAVQEAEIEVTLAMKSLDEWRLTWAQKGLDPRYITEITSYERGVVIEYQGGSGHKKVTDDPWPLLGQHLRGVPAVLAASKIVAGTELAFDKEGHLQFWEGRVVGQQATVVCDSVLSSVGKFVGKDAGGLVRESLEADGETWVWKLCYRGKDNTAVPLQQQAWKMAGKVPVNEIVVTTDDEREAERARAEMAARAKAKASEEQSVSLPSGAPGIKVDALILGTPGKKE